MQKKRDLPTERFVLGYILNNGKDPYYEIADILEPRDFNYEVNRAIYSCIVDICDKNDFEVGPEAVKAKSKELGLFKILDNPQNLQYLEDISFTDGDSKLLKKSAITIKKISLTNDLLSKQQSSINYLNGLDGSETIADIITKVESSIVDIISGISDENDIERIGQGIIDQAELLINHEPVDQVGIPTGFPIWDEAIGGGLLKPTVNLIAARSKRGKSWDAANKAINISAQGIPVIYLDTEMTKERQQHRMMTILSECPISLYATGKFNSDSRLVGKVRNAAKVVSDLPFYYKNISQMSPQEVLAYVRKWIIQVVGLNELGKANDCVVIYDYLKLTSGNQIDHTRPEYIALGLMITELQNFAIKYELPVIAYCQLNRQGASEDSDDTTVAGSDRLLWLCSSLSKLSDKTANDVEQGCGWEFGNKKMHVLDCRYGPGLSVDGDYINIKASLKPFGNAADYYKACGKMEEGVTWSEAVKQNILPNKTINENNLSKNGF